MLWSQAKALLAPKEGSDPSKLTAVTFARAFGDPTWTKEDAPDELGWMDRAKLRATRIYGWPARKLGIKKARDKLGV